MTQRPLSNGFTAFSIALTIFAGYMTLFEVLPLPLGFTLLLGAVILLIASMTSALPTDNELTVQKEIMDADHLEDDL